MDVLKTIKERRAYRSLKPVQIGLELIADLAGCVRLAPSCNNNQPWRLVFVTSREPLEAMHDALSEHNAWAKAASMIIAVCTRKDLDCVSSGREYYLYDAGIAIAFLILRATELGLVAHPIAGYNEEKVKRILKIPEDMACASLVIVGAHSSSTNPLLSKEQAKVEKTRPDRMPMKQFVFIDRYGDSLA
jgi:nitroreductase